MRIWATARRADDRSPGPNSLVRAAGRGAGLAQTATVSTIGRGEDVKVSNCARDHAPDAAPYGATRRRPAAASSANYTRYSGRTTLYSVCLCAIRAKLYSLYRSAQFASRSARVLSHTPPPTLVVLTGLVDVLTRQSRILAVTTMIQQGAGMLHGMRDGTASAGAARSSRADVSNRISA